jgi:hypothetical protein
MIRHAVWIEVITTDGDKELNRVDLGFAESANFERPEDAADFAYQLHLAAAELAKKLKRKAAVAK